MFETVLKGIMCVYGKFILVFQLYFFLFSAYAQKKIWRHVRTHTTLCPGIPIYLKSHVFEFFFFNSSPSNEHTPHPLIYFPKQYSSINLYLLLYGFFFFFITFTRSKLFNAYKLFSTMYDML